MNILCVADNIAPLVYSSHIRERFKSIDLIVGAGDLPMEYLGFISSSLNKPIVFIFGNHQLKHMKLFKSRRHVLSDDHMCPADGCEDDQQCLFGSTYVDNRVMSVNGLIVAGLGGSKQYNGGENQFSEAQMYLKILHLIPSLLINRLRFGRYLDILITHAAPFGIHDKEDKCHIGFRAFLWFMKTFKPRYLLHGHIHLYDQNTIRETDFHQTHVINVYDHYVLSFD